MDPSVSESGNQTSVHSSLDYGNLTAVEFWIQIVVFYGLIAGLISTPCGVLVCAAIVRSKKLHTRFFYIVGCLTFTRTLVAFQFLVVAIYRGLRATGIVSVYQPRLVCHSIHLWMWYGSTAEIAHLFILVVDRFLAVVKPVYYRLLTPQSAFKVCLFGYLAVAVVKLVPSYFLDDMMDMVYCLNVYSFLNSDFNIFAQTVDIFLVVAIISFYIILVLYFLWKRRALQRSPNASDASITIALRRQSKLMPTLRNLVVWHCGLTSMAKLLLYISPHMSWDCRPRFIAVGGVLSCIDVLANIGILLFLNPNIRKVALPCVRCQTSGSEANSRESDKTGQ